MTVGIDANVLVYANLAPRARANKGDSKEQRELTRRAKILLHNLRSEQVILPMIAVAEILVPIPTSKHGLLLNALRDLFVCGEFGDRAASIAADLWAKYKQFPPDHLYDDRIALRADIKIIATAKALGATTFYTNDDDCRKLANLIMQGKGLPKFSEELFFDQILADGSEETPSTRRKKARKKSR